MFKRFTEKSRRVVFYARWEAMNYGSQYIETEHLLLGLLREDRSQRWSPGERNAEQKIRSEIEGRISRAERIPETVEVPLSSECKRVLNLAVETCERLGHRAVEPEHLLIGILRVESSMAAQILIAHGLKLGPIEEKVAKGQSTSASLTLESFLAGLKSLKCDDLADFFAQNAVYIDAAGKRWNREEILKGFEGLFAHYAKKNTTCHVEATLAETSDLLVANVLWKNALLASEERAWAERMSIVLLIESSEWKILLLQVTQVPPLSASRN